jgi:hypothetical protein
MRHNWRQEGIADRQFLCHINLADLSALVSSTQRGFLDPARRSIGSVQLAEASIGSGLKIPVEVSQMLSWALAL